MASANAAPTVRNQEEGEVKEEGEGEERVAIILEPLVEQTAGRL